MRYLALARRNCDLCGVQYKPYSRKSRFCSKKCYADSTATLKHTHRICVVCSKSYTPRQKTTKCCSYKCALVIVRQKAKEIGIARRTRLFNCKQCNARFYAKRSSKGVFCSRACSFAWRKSHPEWNITHRQARVTVVGPLLHLFYKSCEVCGALSKKKLCSIRCERINGQNYWKQKKILKTRLCRQCKKQFIPEYRNKRRIFCSAKCGRKRMGGTKSNRERAKKFGVVVKYFNEIRIFVRDRWHCQLCGISTPKRLKGKHLPNSPELDHIIPLSKGGSHTVENCQCACRRCNGAKSDKPLGQQWLLGFADTKIIRRINRLDRMAKNHQVASPPLQIGRAHV